ncbi:MAG: DUF5399 domain-containing protein [Cyanobacteria bacterium REEB459]|nr:DUF5399 domain-containing protein [Cyanobacteria bacterium REEB459]
MAARPETNPRFFPRWCIFFCGLLVLLMALVSNGDPAFSKTLADCATQQEVFGIALKQYPVDHQGLVSLSIDVTYRLHTPIDTLDASVYPDYLDMVQSIKQFLADYPNESDYWEVVNKQLAQLLLDQYPTLSSVQLKMGLMPSPPKVDFDRFSQVLMTRPGGCPLLTAPSP